MRNLLMRVTPPPKKNYVLQNKLMRGRPILGILRNLLMRNCVSNLKISQNIEEILLNGPKNVKTFLSKKNAEFINANDRNFQVLRNLILRKRQGVVSKISDITMFTTVVV